MRSRIRSPKPSKQETTPRANVLAMAWLACLVLLMPTNYRAGTETAHPHAFFQEMIDLVVGHTHEHGGAMGEESGHDHDHSQGNDHTHSHEPGHDATGQRASSHNHPHEGDPASVMPASASMTSHAPDLPSVSELTPSAEKATAIWMLALVLSALACAGWRRRDLWALAPILKPVARRVEAPPPRMNFAFATFEPVVHHVLPTGSCSTIIAAGSCFS